MPHAQLSEFKSQMTLSRELLRELQTHGLRDSERLRSSREAIASSLALLRRLDVEAPLLAEYGAAPRNPPGA